MDAESERHSVAFRRFEADGCGVDEPLLMRRGITTPPQAAPPLRRVVCVITFHFGMLECQFWNVGMAGPPAIDRPTSLLGPAPIAADGETLEMCRPK